MDANPPFVCQEPGCTRQAYARQRCHTHYYALRREMIEAGTWRRAEDERGWRGDIEAHSAAAKKIVREESAVAKKRKPGAGQWERFPAARRGTPVRIDFAIDVDDAPKLQPNLREIAVLAAVARLGTVIAAAEELGLSGTQATFALERLKDRTGLSYIPQLILWAIQEGWLVTGAQEE